jgi:hypothetical protein
MSLQKPGGARVLFWFVVLAHDDVPANPRTTSATAAIQYARTDKVDGTVWWDGLVFDGWEPAARPQ